MFIKSMVKIILRFAQFPELFFLIGASFISRFWNLSFPSFVVFDETHFGLYATKYLSYQYYFDIHPPLGKMLFALSSWIGGVEPGFDFLIHSAYGDFPQVAIRFLPALFGALLVPLVYLLMRELKFSRKIAFFAGFLVLFDNALVVQSRLVLLDTVLLFFILLSIYIFLLSNKTAIFSHSWYLFSIISGFLLGCAISIKWIGLGALAVIWIYLIFRENIFKKPRKYIFSEIIFFLIIPLLFYILVFTFHLILLPNQCNENCGAVLSESHLDSENAVSYFNTPPEGNLVEKFLVENRRMVFSTFLGQGADHYYQSDWYSWPFMVRPIKYAFYDQNEKTSYLYFFGNPFVWWFSFLGIIGIFYIAFRNYFYRLSKKASVLLSSDGTLFLIIGYLVFFIPFATIFRSVFLYHYLSSLLFSIMIFSVFIGIITSEVSVKMANLIYGAVLLIVLIGFLFFAPLTYSLPLEESEFQMRMWLSTWSF